uniref:Uncharacterized protein n=1 Tax=Anguilla anguilla TaxID=7936 RepID=A0A0E9VRY2_ANGAN
MSSPVNSPRSWEMNPLLAQYPREMGETEDTSTTSSYTLYRITSFVAITSFRSFSKLLWNNASSPALV